MKVVAQTLLVIFFLISFTVVLLTASVKFELLNYNFLTSSFQKHDTYSKINDVVRNSINNQVGKGGGKVNDIAVLTDLITPENTADFVNKNLFNLLNFMNGKVLDLKVYVPIDKVPKEILPKTVSGIKEEMTLDELAIRFNIVGLENLPLKNISQVGLYDYFILMGGTTLLGILLILIMLSIEAGRRFIAVGVAFILSGFISILFVQMGTSINKYITQNFSESTSINKILALTVVPPVLADLVQIWTYVGIGLILLGILMFFVKKANNKSKVNFKTKSVLLPS